MIGNFTIKVGPHQMDAVVTVNKNGNLEISFTEEDLKKMPNGYCVEAYQEELIITPYKP